MQLEALIHPFFDELRDPNARLPNGRILPPLFNFKPHGMTCSQYSFINSFEVPVYDCYWFLSTLRVRAERSASWDACQADPRACKKAVCLPWVVMLSFLAVCSLQKMVLHCREVASGLFNVEPYASCVICYASPAHLFHFYNYFEVYVHVLSLCREQVKKALRNMLLRPPWHYWPLIFKWKTSCNLCNFPGYNSIPRITLEEDFCFLCFFFFFLYFSCKTD